MNSLGFTGLPVNFSDEGIFVANSIFGPINGPKGPLMLIWSKPNSADQERTPSYEGGLKRSSRTLPPRASRIGSATEEMAAVVEAATAEDLKSKIGNLSVKDEKEELEEGEILDEAGGEPSLNPLERTWKFWFDNGAAKSKSTDWGSTMFPIHSFSTVEDFWGLYNNFNGASKFPVSSDFYCFKENIEPKWEDPLCADGGKWTVVFPKGKSEAAWLYTLLAMIGEQFDYGDEICGAVINVRARQEKVSIWTKNASNEIAQTTIGSQWKQMLDYHDAVHYVVHEDAKRDRNAKNKFTV